MVRHICYGMTISTHPSPIGALLNQFLWNTLVTGHRCVEVVILWQLCRTLGPLTFHSQEIYHFVNINTPVYVIARFRHSPFAIKDSVSHLSYSKGKRKQFSYKIWDWATFQKYTTTCLDIIEKILHGQVKSISPYFSRKHVYPVLSLCFPAPRWQPPSCLFAC